MYRRIVTFALVAMAVMAVFLVGADMASAHHGGGFYWQGWHNWDGSYCQGLFNSTHRLVYYRCY